MVSMNEVGCTVLNVMENIDELGKLRSTVNQAIRRQQHFYNDSLGELHNFSLGDINTLRLNCFKAINEIDKLDSILVRLLGNEIEKILGPDILVQRKVNVSIQMPGDHSSILKPHSDCWSGDSPFQINAWIPLTDAFGSNSMFIFDRTDSVNILNNIYNGKDPEELSLIDPSKFLSLKFGEVLLFNPALVHGNVLNQTDRTRVSLNVRFKSVFTPDGIMASRSSGVYYRVFTLSEWTRLAFELNETNNGGK
jgi:sporadic carbohydrate cluster 2OG-Fe(II) oxygenase